MVKLSQRDWTQTWTSAAYALHDLVSHTDKQHFTLVDIMGLTGHAFRINVERKRIHSSGPTLFPGGYILRRNLVNLGFISNLADPERPVSPELAEQTIALVKDSIDRGMPAIVFGMFDPPEFSLIDAYDDEKQVFSTREASKTGSITYKQFVQPSIHVLFAVTISESLPHSKYEMLRMALEMIVDHMRGQEWNPMFKKRAAMGLEAYDAWIDVLQRRKVDVTGNAYNIEIVQDAREFAAEFLRRLAVQWDGTNIVERTVRDMASRAVVQYDATARIFGQLRELFPFPNGGTPNELGIAEQAITLLKQAKLAEEKGLAILEQLLYFMRAYNCETWINPSNQTVGVNQSYNRFIHSGDPIGVPEMFYDGAEIDVLWDNHDKAIAWYETYMGWEALRKQTWWPDKRVLAGRMSHLGYGTWLNSVLTDQQLPFHYADRDDHAPNIRWCWGIGDLNKTHTLFSEQGIRTTDIYKGADGDEYFDFWEQVEGTRLTARGDKSIKGKRFRNPSLRIGVRDLRQAAKWYSEFVGMVMLEDHTEEGYLIMALSEQMKPKAFMHWILEERPNEDFTGDINGPIRPLLLVKERSKFFGYYDYLTNNGIPCGDFGGFVDDEGRVLFHLYDPDGNRLNICHCKQL